MNGQWDTGRTEAFSDGVLAVAITLLVLDIGVPESHVRHFWYSVGHIWPTYLAYLTSFATIGGLWMAHHAIFSRLAYVDRTIMSMNLALLLSVSFLPFPTRLMAEALRITSSERAAVIFYGGCLLISSLLLNAIWRVIAARPQLLQPNVPDSEIREILRATTPNLGFYVSAMLIAIVAPRASAFAYLVVAITLIVPIPGTNRLTPVGRRRSRKRRAEE
jgi:uncharacterized membrane protein